MSTTLAWVYGVWYVSPAKFSAPIFQFARTRHRCGPRSSRPPGALVDVEVEEEREPAQVLVGAAVRHGRG